MNIREKERGENMNFNEYQKLAQRTSNTRCSTTKLVNGVMGLNGEAGECADLVKKHMYQGHDMYVEDMVKELGDVLWYIAEICEGLGVGMEEVAIHNIKKLKKRYPDGFEEERSINRNE